MVILPSEYKNKMGIRETEIAIKMLKDHFERELADTLNLTRVSAPLFVRPETGLNDNLNGIERPVGFDIKEFGCDVEIEFAVNLPEDEQKPKEFNFLQVRPMVVGKEMTQTKIMQSDIDNALARSCHTIGNGLYEDIYDIIYVDPTTFKIEDTIIIANEIEQLNKVLYAEKRKCILAGFGRLGTYDRWLGIPLTWSQMSQARVVIECEQEKLKAEPSMGSHFYHNLTSLSMGYFHIGHIEKEDDFISWDRLKAEKLYMQKDHVKLIRSDTPYIVKIDGSTSQGIIYKTK